MRLIIMQLVILLASSPQPPSTVSTALPVVGLQPTEPTFTTSISPSQPASTSTISQIMLFLRESQAAC